MDEKRVEDLLDQMKDRIPINTRLKRELRKSFARRSRFIRTVWGSVAAAVLLLLGLLNVPLSDLQRVEAAELKVQNQVSFIDLGSGSPLGAEEYQGTVYVPVAGKGLYVYDDRGFHRLTDREIQEVRVNEDGTKLLWAGVGTIGIYDVTTKKWVELLKGDGNFLFYENPSWAGEDAILYVKKVVEPGETHGFEVKESGIYRFNLETRESQKLGDGSNPSYIKDKNAILYQKESDNGPQIVYKDLDTGKETWIDHGRFPSVSRDGKYVAYVKYELKRRELKPNAFVEENLDNVWISDTDGTSKQMVTANLPQKTVDETEWLKQIKPGTTPQTLSLYGMYSYYNPVWSSDSQSLYVIKNRNAEGGKMSLMRIDFSKKILAAEETVRAFNQATILRDLDYARSLLKKQQEVIIPSNPHKVSFTLLGHGEEEGREYVDVEEAWGYTANPYYSIKRVRYYLVKAEQGYLIDEMKELGDEITVLEAPDGSIRLERGDQKQTLITKEDLPKELLPAGDYRIASLANVDKQGKLIFTIQALQDEEKNQRASVRIVAYDTKGKTFKLLQHITSIKQYKNVGVANMIVSPDGNTAALDLFSDDDPTYRSHVLVCDLTHGDVVWPEDHLQDEIEGTNAFYWDGEQLHFNLISGEQVLHYKWDAGKKMIRKP